MTKITDLMMTTAAFNTETIDIGDLISVFDGNGIFIGSGIILDVQFMELRIALHAEKKGHGELYVGDFGEFDQLIPFRLPIEQIMAGEYKIAIIDPKMVEL